MLLPRRQYLKIAGVNEAHFKSLQRRDQVPLSGRETLGLEDLDATGYLPIDGVQLALSDSLTSASVSRDDAKHLVESYWNVIFDLVEAYQDDKTGGFWLVLVGRELFFERSPLKLSNLIEDAVATYSDPEMTASVGPCKVVMVDVKPMLEAAFEAASEIGLPSILPSPSEQR